MSDHRQFREMFADVLIMDRSGRCSQMTDHGQVREMVLGEDEGHRGRGGGSED
jgi:hypothetical protein